MNDSNPLDGLATENNDIDKQESKKIKSNRHERYYIIANITILFLELILIYSFFKGYGLEKNIIFFSVILTLIMLVLSFKTVKKSEQCVNNITKKVLKSLAFLPTFILIIVILLVVLLRMWIEQNGKHMDEMGDGSINIQVEQQVRIQQMQMN